MKKIRSTTHLKAEKSALRVRELELEKQIRKDWSEIKEGLQPKNLLHLAVDGKTGEEHWLVNMMSTAAKSLTEKALKKAEQKIGDKTEEGIGFIGRKLHRFMKSAK